MECKSVGCCAKPAHARSFLGLGAARHVARNSLPDTAADEIKSAKIRRLPGLQQFGSVAGPAAGTLDQPST